MNRKIEVPKSISELDFDPHGEVYPSPRDWRDIFIYFLLIDRFDDSRRYAPPFNPDFTPKGRDPRQGGIFQGGNLNGVTRRLDYIKNLGCNALWISPIFKNRQERVDTYHGYGIQDFLSIDPRFGNREDLKRLVKEAHSRGIYVILDIIINHTGDNWAYLGGEKAYRSTCPHSFGFWRRKEAILGKDDAVWPQELQNPLYYKKRGSIRDFKGAGLEEIEDGDFATYKKLDMDHPSVMDCLIKIYKYWIAISDVDGFRLDTARHLGPGPCARFCNAIKEYCRRIGKHNFLIFGEVSGDDEQMRSYLCRRVPISGREDCLLSLEAALDFPLNETLEMVFKKGGDPARLKDRYLLLEEYYQDRCSPGSHLVTFLDNHDRNERFMHGLESTNLVLAALGYLITSPGIPCLYYGTEQGFDGHGDKDHYVRECLFGGRWGAFDTTGVHFFDDQSPFYQHIKVLAKIRREQPALRYGRMHFREVSWDGRSFEHPSLANRLAMIAFSRLLDQDEILVAINLSSEERRIWVGVEEGLYPSGGEMVSLMRGVPRVPVRKKLGRSYVVLSIHPYQLLILKNKF
ncbi:alpha-amylase family glycosyl hydrolase [Methanothrix soehngenii]|jgi:glycosidase|uniref:alpha-amylase family glycosyl hydrolase n=1 Tax=Methanothrix soehngenii TaxID=2223 RepID=UPI002BB4F5F9|nr:alpha-amylase family glycosyl hydrolase [Methanothrix soehngenii]HOS22825.1 alpha-amylase family glycosyl hydrolase [Methanothrix soehngenii]HPL21587.1 alpha-amylase family glycosyl hydrolase [Methanothrix soehngenii]